MNISSRLIFLFAFVLFVIASVSAQDEPSQPVPPAGDTSAMGARTAAPRPSISPNDAGVPDLAAFHSTIDRLNRVSQTAVMDLGALQIEKWKADRSQKQQAQSNADSLQKNLTAAVPELTQKALAAPGDIVPSFRLYRNLNALYDVLASLTESAGAFGAKDRYERLAADVAEIDAIRRAMADRVDTLAGNRDSELANLRARTRALAAQATAAPVKKVVVDDTKPAKASTKKKKPKPPATPADSAAKE